MCQCMGPVLHLVFMTIMQKWNWTNSHQLHKFDFIISLLASISICYFLTFFCQEVCFDTVCMYCLRVDAGVWFMPLFIHSGWSICGSTTTFFGDCVSCKSHSGNTWKPIFLDVAENCYNWSFTKLGCRCLSSFPFQHGTYAGNDNTGRFTTPSVW